MFLCGINYKSSFYTYLSYVFMLKQPKKIRKVKPLYITTFIYREWKRLVKTIDKFFLLCYNKKCTKGKVANKCSQKIV